MDWPWKTTPNWPLTCWNLSTGTKVIVRYLCMSVVFYSVQLIWAHHWIDLKKLPQIDPSNIEIHLYRELNQQKKFYKPYQTICIDNVISPLNWPWKTTPNWPFTCCNPSTGTKVIIRSVCLSAVLYSVQLIWAHHQIGLEKLSQIDPSHIEILSYL